MGRAARARAHESEWRLLIHTLRLSATWAAERLRALASATAGGIFRYACSVVCTGKASAYGFGLRRLPGVALKVVSNRLSCRVGACSPTERTRPCRAALPREDCGHPRAPRAERRAARRALHRLPLPRQRAYKSASAARPQPRSRAGSARHAQFACKRRAPSVVDLGAARATGCEREPGACTTPPSSAPSIPNASGTSTPTLSIDPYYHRHGPRRRRRPAGRRRPPRHISHLHADRRSDRRRHRRRRAAAAIRVRLAASALRTHRSTSAAQRPTNGSRRSRRRLDWKRLWHRLRAAQRPYP